MAQVEQMLDVPDVMAALKVSRWTVYQMLKRKELTRVKVGRATRIRASDIRRFTENSENRPMDASPSEALT